MKYQKPLIIGAVFSVFVTIAHAQSLDGSLDSAFYGNPLAVQTISSGFGAAPGGDDSYGGSELDAAYGQISGGNLFLFLSGNLENNGNHLNIFIDGGAAGGQNILNLPGPGSPGPVMAYMNGSVFSPGFNATFAMDLNDYSGTLYSEEYLLSSPGTFTGGYVGSLPESSTGIAAGNAGGVSSLYLNNNNASTMGAPGTAYLGGAAVTTGLELVVPLSAIGWTGGSIMVLADINGAYPSDTYLSNQFLPGLPVGTQNLGGPTFDFSSTPNEYFTVVPEPSVLGLFSFGMAALVACYHKKKK